MRLPSRRRMLRAALFSSLLMCGCRGAPIPTDNERAVQAQTVGTASSHHGASILQPSSNVTLYAYPSQIASYAVNTETEFWLTGTFSFTGFRWWNRDIRWRSCGSNAAGTVLHAASLPIFSGQTYDERYTQPTSFTPGAYGQYEILSRSLIRWCTSGGFCTEADSVRSSRCVTLADFSVAISGPSSVFAERTATWTAAVSGSATPFTYQWYRDGVASGNSPSITLNTGATNFSLQVDVTDANSQTRTATQSVSVSLAPPTNCQLEKIPPPANYLKVSWANSGDAASTEVEINRSSVWTPVATVEPGVTQYFYTLGSQTGIFYARVRHVKQGYNASGFCSTGAVTV